MAPGFDITESDAQGITFDIALGSPTGLWTNTQTSFDTAIGGMPFIYAINDQNPYIRQTAAFRKEQFDNQAEPGEQSLTGWWLRSQSSFHDGAGINYADPTGGESATTYRFQDSRGVNVWEKGKVTLLNEYNRGHLTTEPVVTTGIARGRSMQQIRSTSWTGLIGADPYTVNGILFHDGYDVDKMITWTGNDGYQNAIYYSDFINYLSGASDKVYALCDDGAYAYWVTNDTGPSGKLEVLKKVLTTDASTPDTTMFTAVGITVQNAVMEYIKDRIILACNNKIYEFSTSASSLPSPVYTHSSTDVVFTGITASGTAIYVSYWNGAQSGIYKFTLNTNGTMPTLTSAITAAEMAPGERVHTINFYLGYLLIGTNKGLRVAQVDGDGSLAYGPLSPATSTPVHQIACRENYAYITAIQNDAFTNLDDPGLIRVDLSNQIDTLRFAYANDVFYNIDAEFAFTPAVRYATAVGFLGTTNDVCFATPAAKQAAVTNKERTGNTVTLTVPGHKFVAYDSIYVLGVDATIDTSTIVGVGTQSRSITAVTTSTITFSAPGADIPSTAVPNGIAGVAGSFCQPNQSNALIGGTINPGGAYSKVPSGYLQTGKIRYNTLEPKNYKRLLARCKLNNGSILLQTVDSEGIPYNVITYNEGTQPQEANTNQPTGAQTELSYRFQLNRDAQTVYEGPELNGYQAKATIASPRQRVIRFPVWCYDVETDLYNVTVGWEGRAIERIQALEDIEQNGDIVTWQDFTTGESRQCVIEQITFTRMTPPDRGYSGYGGIVNITIRTII